MFGRDFKIFKVGSDNKAVGEAVLELEIDSVGFTENAHLFEIKLQSGVSHEFKCSNGDEFNQWKRALSDYRGRSSAAVETTTFTEFAKKIFCLFASDIATEGMAQMFGEGDDGEGGTEEFAGAVLPEDEEEEEADGDDDLDPVFDLGGGLASEFLDE